MRKNSKKGDSERSAGGYSNSPSHSEFYSGSPSEKPLMDDSRTSGGRQVRMTGRHQAVANRRPETMDPREKMALMAILKSVIMILLLMIAFFMLWKGVSIYEERVLLDNADAAESTATREILVSGDFDVADTVDREQLAERITGWKDANRLVRSADALLQRNIYDQAIEQCREALLKDPVHSGALERLGQLFFAQGNYAEAVNVYIRLLSIDPARQEIQKRLIQTLDALGDHEAVRFMAGWYLEENLIDVDIQRYLANALRADEEYAAAAEAYGHVVKSDPDDVQSLEHQVAMYMQIEEYEKALEGLEALLEKNYRTPAYYKQVSVCHAQLLQSQETVEVLGRAALMFGEKVVIEWIQDPLLNPVREDRAFQAFTDRIGGEEFRLWLEKMAQNINVGGNEETELGPQLDMPEGDLLQEDVLLKPR